MALSTATSVPEPHTKDDRAKTKGEQPSRQAFALMASAALLFAMMNVLARKAGAYLGSTEVMLARSFVGLLVSATLVAKNHRSLRVIDRRSTLLRCGLGTVAMSLTFYVLSKDSLPLGVITTLFNLTPIFVACLSPIVIGERVPAKVVALAFVALVSVAMIAFFQNQHPTTAIPLRVSIQMCIFAALAALFSAGAMLALRTLGQAEPAETIAFHYATVTTSIVGIIAFYNYISASQNHGSEEYLRAWRNAAPYLLATGLTGGIAQILMTRAYALDIASRVASYGYLNVAFGAILGAAVLHENVHIGSIVGMVGIVGAGLLTLRAGNVHPASSDAKSPPKQP
jgi:drug/metabolite transporter (DMT)-like permease